MAEQRAQAASSPGQTEAEGYLSFAKIGFGSSSAAKDADRYHENDPSFSPGRALMMT